MGIKSTAKILVIYQSQEILISLKQSEVSKLYCFSLEYPNRRKIN